MGKFWIMGITVTILFVTGLYVFLPNQYGKVLPDFTSFQVMQSPLAENNSVAAKGVLPPKLQELNNEALKMAEAFQGKKTAIDQQVAATPADAEVVAIQQRADALIAEFKAKHGTEGLSVMTTLASTTALNTPESKQMQANVDAIRQQIFKKK